MAALPKRFLARVRPALRKYQRILAECRDRDVNESDTVTIISDFLHEVLGFDKYSEVTSEHAIRGTYCDLAVRIGSRIRFLIEAKAIGQDLRDNHLRQAVDYGANEGIEWVLLTNGAIWQAHRVKFKKPISHEEVLTINLLDDDLKSADLLERLFVLSREACASDAIDLYHRRQAMTSRFVLAQLVLSDRIVGTLRREVRRLAKGLKIDGEEIANRLRVEVLKRDVIEGDQASDALRLMKRGVRRRARRSEPTMTPPPSSPPIPAPRVQLH